MNILRWTAIMATTMLFAVACGGPPDRTSQAADPLPSTWEITQGGNLYQATADLCGTVASDEQGRGRWRRWMESDERVAKAPTRVDSRWGTVVVIQPGVYNVPRDLCTSEAGIPTWLGLLLTLIVLLSIGGTLMLRDRRRRRMEKERGRRFAHAPAS